MMSEKIFFFLKNLKFHNSLSLENMNNELIQHKEVHYYTTWARL